MRDRSFSWLVLLAAVAPSGNADAQTWTEFELNRPAARELHGFAGSEVGLTSSVLFGGAAASGLPLDDTGPTTT